MTARASCCRSRTRSSRAVLPAPARSTTVIAMPTPGQYGVGMLFMPPDPYERRALEARFEEIVGVEGQRVLGWRTVPGRRQVAGRDGCAHASRWSARCSSAAAPAWTTTWPSSASCTSSAGGPRRRIRYGDMAGRRLLLRRQPVVPDDRLQGHADGAAAGRVLSRPGRPDRGNRPGPGPFALQHQYLPQLGAGAALPLHDATTARSTRCAATSTGCTHASRCWSRSCSAMTWPTCCR